MTSSTEPDFTRLPDLASRSVGGSVIWASDESFAEKENLVGAHEPEHRAHTFGHKGQVYDGWETRRHRPLGGRDDAVIRLGAPGIVSGVVVDTTWFKGNYPPEIGVDAAVVDGYPPAEEVVANADWQPLVPRSAARGDSRNLYAVDSDRRWTHVRVTMFPDGGISRLRVHGRGRPDPVLLGAGPIDLVSVENGATVLACSNDFYNTPHHLLLPGPARSMGEGWETSRRRDDGNDWVHIALAAEGTPRLVEIDTSYYLGNAPGSARLTGRTADGTWVDLLPPTLLQPDMRHRLLLLPDVPPVTEVRLDIHPDGGLSRLRLYGEPTAAGRLELEAAAATV